MSLPPSPFLAWTLHVNDKSGEWSVTPLGHQNVSIILFALLISIPLITAFIAAAIFRYSFYAIKVNKWGIKPAKETSYFPIGGDKKEMTMATTGAAMAMSEKPSKSATPAKLIGWPEIPSKRRKVLIATLEYEILDWKLKVKWVVPFWVIGGLLRSLELVASASCPP
jgi:alpha-1,3-glucan synthase